MVFQGELVILLNWEMNFTECAAFEQMLKGDSFRGRGFQAQNTCGGVQPFGVFGPHWKKKKSCLGPHVIYIGTCDHKKISSCFK